jgi:protein-S-isoprenylcysteine O-methyltransferase Ste14
MNETDPLLIQITEALETAPNIPVPSDFAARVMARVPRQKTHRMAVPAIAKARYGQAALVLAMVLLVAAMLYLAPETRTSNTWLLLQGLLLAQLAFLAIWFGHLRQT